MNADSWYAIPQVKSVLNQYKGLALVAERSWNKSLIISYNHVHFFIDDNGGEINVQKVNSPDVRPFPTTGKGLESLNTETIMYRLLAVLKGEEIDYSRRENELEEVKPASSKWITYAADLMKVS